MDETVLHIVRSPAWQALLRRLDAAVTHDPRLAEARDTVLRPVELLRVMAADAHGALADDVLRADRLRAMLFVTWPYVAVAVEARKLLAAKTPPSTADTTMLAEVMGSVAGASHTLAWPEIQPYEPGVIDHAGLLVLALAAARVADPPFAPVFVASIQGLALAASAAEVLGRLDPRQPDADSLDVVLQTLYLIETARTVTRNESLRPFAFDPVERGRWRCLSEMMTSELMVAAVKMGRAWDGATSDDILHLASKAAAPGQPIIVEVRGKDPLAKASVVFASADGKLREAKAKTGSVANTIEVTVPDGAVPGWIGFSRSDLIKTSKDARKVLRKLLTTELEKPCVDGVDRIDPARSIPDYGSLATPRRRGANRYEGGIPIVAIASVSPSRAQPGDSIELRWESVGADTVTVAIDDDVLADAEVPTGSLVAKAPVRNGEVTITVTPRGARGVPGAAWTGTFRVQLPTAHVVLVRPAIVGLPSGDAEPDIVGPLDIERARSRVIAAAEAAGVAASVVELPWLDDELAVLAGCPSGDADPKLLRMLEALSRRALVTPGFEHAIWLAVLPELPEAASEHVMYKINLAFRGIARSLPADPARAVAVATPAGLPRLFTTLFPTDRKPDKPVALGPRLAIGGTLDDDRLVLDTVRVDERGQGPGAPSKTPLVAVTLDEQGRELEHVPIRVLSDVQPATITALVPVSAEVGSIEIREAKSRVALETLRRTPGELRVSILSASVPSFTWEWNHTRNARPTASLLLERDGIETPVLDVDPCFTDVEVPLSRFRSGSLGLYATDGWNTAKPPKKIADEFQTAGPVVLRRLSDGRFFADVPEDWNVTWLVDDAPQQSVSRTFDVPPGRHQLLKLEARDEETMLWDSVRIER